MSTPLPPLPPSYPVQVHHYYPSTTSSKPAQTYEHLVPSSSSSPPLNALVFIHGLGDGPHTIPYVRRLAKFLAGGGAPGWSVFEARLSSGFSAFGYSSLRQDVDDIRGLVKFLRQGLGRQKLVLLGHSTGCQDCLEYAAMIEGRGTWAASLLGEEDKEGVKVDGYVLQGPVSDREAIGMVEDEGEVRRATKVAERMVKEGRGEEVMSREELPRGWRGSPVTGYRWWSLAAVGGDDDYFSSDLPDSRLAEIWGNIDVPVLIVPSEKEEWVPSSVDVPGMIERWKSFAKPGIVSELGGLIPGANHRVDNDQGQEWLSDRVARFLRDIETRP